MRIPSIAGALLLCVAAQATPAWVSSLPDRPGRVYGVGLARVDGSEADAIREAGRNARGEVLSRLRADVASDLKVRTRATTSRDSAGGAWGASEQRVEQSTRIRTSATDLPGLSVEAVWVDAASATAYALACLEVPVAEREIRVRFQALEEALPTGGAAPAGPRERLRRLGRLREARNALATLDDMAALAAAGGGDPVLRRRVHEGRIRVDRRMEDLRASLTLSMEGTEGEGRIAEGVRNAALRAGLGWREAGGEFRLVMDLRAGRKAARLGPRTSAAPGGDTGIIVARGVLTLTLQDRSGTRYESVAIEAKGLGLTGFQAESDLRRNIQAQVEKTFIRWLEDLVR